MSENAIQRYKTIIGSKLHRRDFENQQQELMLGASILNRFIQLGMPESDRVAYLHQKTEWIEYGNKAMGYWQGLPMPAARLTLSRLPKKVDFPP